MAFSQCILVLSTASRSCKAHVLPKSICFGSRIMRNYFWKIETSNNAPSNYVIDVRSDAVSLPTCKMRKAMFEAEVGDDIYREDPTINKLEKYSAAIFEKEDAMFVPSGTMANLLALMIHCHRRGTEALVGDLTYTFLLQQNAMAHIAGVHLSAIKNEYDGTFSLDELRRKIHESITSLVVVENTHNHYGGKIVPLDWLDELAAVVKEHNKNGGNIALHMDGARIFNASEALQVSVARITRDFDSVCFCLSKGLSAPVGSVLVGSKSFIEESRRLRKDLGGAMRQAGILAAAGLVALETILPCLVDDHKRAKLIAEAIDNMKSKNFQVDLPNVQTNMFIICILNPKIQANGFAERLTRVEPEEIAAGVTSADKRGIAVKVFASDWNFVRLVLYRQISDCDAELIIKKLEYVIREYDRI